MDTDALVCLQQTRRGAGERWFKVYRVDVPSPDDFVERMERYVRRTHFDGAVTAPHWFDTGDGPVMKARLAELGEKLVPFATVGVFVATHRAVEPFLAVPMAVDLVPALADAVRVREYRAADCDTDGNTDGDTDGGVGADAGGTGATLAPAPDATPVRTVDAGTFEAPLAGEAGEGGRTEWFHLVTLRAAYRLLVGPRTGVVDRVTHSSAGSRTGSGDAGGGHLTMRVRDGGGVLCVDLLDSAPLKRLNRDVLFLGYAPADERTGDGGEVDGALTAALHDTGRLRYRHARHLWHVRHGHTDERFATAARNEAEPPYGDERAATRAAFLEALCERYGAALAPFSGGSYGAALRWTTGTRSDTFSLNEPPTFDHDPAVEVVDRLDPAFVPEKRKKRF